MTPRRACHVRELADIFVYSEFFGRRPVYLVSFGIFVIFQIPVSLVDYVYW
jgi:hypothetical protein